MIGQVVSHYKILEELGGGGMGIVYKAQDTRLNRNVALKFLPPQFTKDPEAKERFIHEAQAASSLDHPNICTIHEINESADGQLFICMTHYEGETLKDILERQQLRVDEAVDIAMQIGQGLAKAHEQGIVHRDIKPANVIVTNESVAKILDFGLAKIADIPLTQMAGVVGTAAYMSPEQAGGGRVDHRTDIWALGVTLYEMLTGRIPFQGAYEQAIIYAILNVNPEPVTALRPEVPAELSHIITRALQKNPADRYQQMQAMVNDLWNVSEQFGYTAARKKMQGVAAPISLAVLPFMNLSAEKNQDYFCDGLTQDLRDQLVRICGLRVIPHSIVVDIENRYEDIRDIGRELKAEALLEGAVRKSNDRLRVTLQLINVVDGRHLWAGRYDRPLPEVFDVKNEITLAIPEKLGVHLSEEEKTDLAKHQTDSLPAYDAYLNGRHQSDQFSKEHLFESIYHYQHALQQDPQYAAAYAFLGKANFLLAAGYFDVPPAEVYPDALDAASQAMALDQNMAEAFAVAGAVKYRHEYEWQTAEQKLRQAVDIEPDNIFAHEHYGLLLSALGRHEEATEEAATVCDLDPRGYFSHLHAGLINYHAGNSSAAIVRLKRAVDLIPAQSIGYILLGWAYLQSEEYDLARQSLKQGRKSAGDTVFSLLGTAYGFAVMNARKKAADLLGQLEDQAEREFVSPTLVAQVHASLGNESRALEYLERGRESHDSWYAFVGVNPGLAPLRKDQRFRDQLAAVGLNQQQAGVTEVGHSSG